MNLSSGIISEIISEKAVLHLSDKIIFLNQYFQINSVFCNAAPSQDRHSLSRCYFNILCAQLLKEGTTYNQLKPPKPTYNHLQPPTTTSKISTTIYNHRKNIYNHPQTIEYHLKQAINV